MNGALLVLIILVVAAIGFAVYATSKASGKRNAASLADAKADARRVIERLGGQVFALSGTDDASKQALADASERYTAASSQIDQATTATSGRTGQGERDGGSVLRACRAHRDGHGPRTGAGVAVGSAHGRHRHRGPSSGVRGTRDRGVPEPVGAHPELLPGWTRRRPSGARRLVLRAVVEAGARRGRVGRGFGAPVQHPVLRHGRSRL